MRKKEMYPKTKRLSCSAIEKVRITEKCDGSNLAIYKHEGELFICQRKTVFSLNEFREMGKALYPGLFEFLDKNGIYLATYLHEGSVVCGEWLGMGKLNYEKAGFTSRFLMFAKARYNAELDKFENFDYHHENFKWIFDNHEESGFPAFMTMVPEVSNITFLPTKEDMDELYAQYCAEVGRDVEGFIIEYNNSIQKYVRKKNGKMCEHFDRE